MGKKLFLFLIMFMPFVFSSCGGDGDEPESPEQVATRVQNELFNELQRVLPGHWVGAQHYNTSVYRETGWEDISNIYWDIEYTFSSNGTFVEQYTKSATHEGTWKLEKNPDYIKYPTTSPEVYIVFTYNVTGLGQTKKAIWLDGDNHEFMRISYATLGIKPSNTSGGEASIRNKKVN